ncbi:2-C-methyl-D-erythritol 4-phosphate cytidylyltransferase [bacterium]|nr:2-C-methyl-D-erythritol 4-phosphate cytidylyltransferase [bacterium]
MFQKETVSAIIVAAGVGQRFGGDKLLLSLAGKPVIIHTVSAFVASKYIDEIIIVCHPHKIKSDEKLLRQTFPQANLQFVTGGEERWQSSLAGIQATSSDLIAIHDAARPLITTEQIDDSIKLASRFGAAMVAAPATDSIKIIDKNGDIADSLDRSQIYLAQTPQTFRKELILQAFDQAAKQKYQNMTDESELITKFLHRSLKIVPSSNQNLKITFRHDLPLAETFYHLKQEK